MTDENYIAHYAYAPHADVLKVLQDLDETSLHSVEILQHFVVSSLGCVSHYAIVYNLFPYDGNTGSHTYC